MHPGPSPGASKAARRPAAAGQALLLTTMLALPFPGAAAEPVGLEQLAWAYAAAPAPAPPQTRPSARATGSASAVARLDAARLSLPGAAQSFTLAEIGNRFGPADWYPADHPAMPEIVAVGRKEAGILACSLCHYPNGKGRPENAALAGLQKDYIVRQLHEFARGLRRSAEPRKANTALMIGFASAMTEKEIEQAADYFSSLPWTPWIEVVETEVVPKTRIRGGMHLRLEGTEAGDEPIGSRIIESPKDTERTERLRDPRSGFVAYVPTGAVERGEALASTGAGRTIRCATCHGENLGGLALVPPLRGRSPSYIARQLYDFKMKTRHGTWAPLMSAVVADLTAQDMLDLAAYVASLPPTP